MLDPNIAFRDRFRKPDMPIVTITFKSSRLVWFNCPGCGHKYNSVMHAGMTFYPDNLNCPACHECNMEFTIDP